MILASTTLTANNENLIADALTSIIDLVDVCIVVDTGATDNSLNIAEKIAGSKLVKRTFDWRNDYSAARNFALDCAFEYGADWAITVDTDERISLDNEALRDTLACTSSHVLLLPFIDHSYTKERIFRLPSSGRFVGPTHEYFSDTASEMIDHGSFDEIAKTEEQYQQKFLRDIEILSNYVKQHPEDPRWHYYLGESLRDSGEYPRAIAAYNNCAMLNGWAEESAWACFQSAKCHEQLGQYQQVIDVACVGMAKHPGIAELQWYAAYASQQLGRYEDAVYWGRLALTWGLYEGNGAKVKRIGFRYQPALFEGPYDVLQYAYGALGLEKERADAEAHYAKAITARQKYEGLCSTT